MAELKNLIVEGDSRLIGDTNAGKVTATSFVKSGGTSAQFLKADGTVDSNTYATTSQIPSVSNATITVKQTGISDQTFTLNGSATTINLDNTTYSNATQSAAGLMSSTDKAKLDSCASSSNNANVGYDSTNKKITKTINGTTSDVVTVATLKTAMSLAKGDVGLSNVTNDSQVKRSEMGAASGVATLDSAGKVPQSQLPSYVDDVLEYASLSNFPTTGETGKIYVALDTNKTYRWGGSSYVVISETLSLGETSSTAYRGDRGKAAYDHASLAGSAFASGLYKITTNAAGHVTAATAVAKADITALGIPGSDTNTTYTLTSGAGTADDTKIILTPSSGSAQKITVPYASSAGVATSAGSAPWTGITDRPTKLSQFTNDVVNNSTITIKQTGISDQTFTLNGSAKTITLADTNTWRPLGTGATDACAGNDSRLSDARPASDVYSWAKASTKPSYAFNEITHGVATIGDGANRLMFRTNDSYRNGIYYSTPGNEALVFATKYNVTSWIFATADPVSQGSWQNITPSLQIKNQKVAINKLIANGSEGSYNLDVNGTLNATTIYQNGTALATVATSGSYNDLSNKPTFPSVNNATLTIQKNGTNVASFTANSASDVTANITVPTKTSELTNNSGYVTTDNKTLQTVTTSSNTSWRPLIIGDSYSDAATFAPSTTTAGTYATHLAKFAPSTGILAVVGLNKMNTNGTTATGSNSAVFNTNGGTTTLASVATSGSYNDLSNKPTIPTVPTFSSLTLSKTAQAYDGTHTLALPSTDPYTSARTPSSHTHGNIQNGGTLQTNDITIANGDKLVVTDSSDSSKVARTSVSFDGSTTTKALTQKGTFETFLQSHQSVVNAGATLAWGQTTQIATIGGTGIGVTMPSNPNTNTWRQINVNGVGVIGTTDSTAANFMGGGLVSVSYDAADGIKIEGPTKVTSISSSSADTQVPTAKAVYTYVNNIVGDIESALAALR